MMGLTQNQARCLRFLEDYIREHQGAPTFGEIAGGIGVKSKASVARLIGGLEERGRIRRIPGRMRAIEIIDQPQEKVIGFLPPDVRGFLSAYASAHHVLPETIIAERMREWAEHEASKRRVA